MAANYKVNIQLDTKTLDKQLKDLGVKIDKVGKVKQGQGKKQLSEAEAALKLEQQQTKEEIKQIQLRNKQLVVETGIKKVKSKMVDINKTKEQLSRATEKIDAKQFDLANKEILLSREDLLITNKILAAEKKVTVEKAKQVSLRSKERQVNLQSVGMNLIRLSGKAGRLGGRTAAVIDQQTALRQPKGLPSSAMLNAEARGIKRLGQTPSILGPSNRGIDREIGKDLTFTATSAKKAAMFEERINKARKRGIANNKKLIGSEVARNKQTLQAIKAEERRTTSEARRLNQALRNPIGPSSPLNRRGGQVLPGPAGSGRGGGLTSALISGAFPLLFGQGPFAAAGGFTGGLIGDKLGGQMGGFAGGLIGTSVITGIQGFITETGKLGAALNDATKDITALSAALGITGTEFEQQLQTLQKLGGEEAAFEAARRKMINLVGQEGVTALQNFGKQTTELANQFTIAMTQMRSAFASFLQGSGVGRALTNRLTAANLQRQAKVSTDPLVIEALKLKRAKEVEFSVFKVNEEQRALIDKFPEIKTVDDALKNIEKVQAGANERADQAALDELRGDIQKQRVKDINEEVALLERSFNMSSDEFEIEKQIMEINKEVKILNEEELRTGLRRIQDLEKQRDLARETAEAFKQMQQTIATDIADGIQGMIRGTSTLNDVLSNVLNKLIDASFNMAFFGNMQGSLGGGGGLFGSILGMFGGGKNKNSGILDGVANPFGGGGSSGVSFGSENLGLSKFANGGRPPVGRASIVGERGPELFVPDRAGTIIPNDAMGGSTSIVVNVDASGSSVQSDGDGQQFGEALATAIQLEIVKQKRSGGLLA